MVSCSELKRKDDEEDEQLDFSKVSPSNIDDKVLTILEALPAGMSWKQIFHLRKEMCEQIVFTLSHVKLYADKVKDIQESAKRKTQCITHNTTVSFTDDDLLLVSKPHNLQLFVTGCVRGQKVKRILVDCSLAINIMPKSIITNLGITVEELSKSRMMVQGFNLDGQRAIGMMRLELSIGDLS